MPTCPKCGHKHHDYEPHVPTIVAPDIWADPTYNIDSKYAYR
jgi:hypothetical protein